MSYSPLDGHKYSVNYVEFSPSGMMLASCSMDGSTMVWNVETGTPLRSSFVNSGAAVRVCRWAPDGTKIATAGDDEKCTLWELDDLDEIKYVSQRKMFIKYILSHFIVSQEILILNPRKFG